MKGRPPFTLSLGGVMNQDAVLMDMLGSGFQIISYSAIGLFVAALIVVVWLCCTEDKSSDR
jgi:hypothetical protein